MTAPTLARPDVERWMPVPDVLRHAADLIDRYGLARDGYGSNYTGYSVDGAIYRAVRVIDHNGMPDVDWGDAEAQRRHELARDAFVAFASHVNGRLVPARSAFRLTAAESERYANPGTAVAALRAAAGSVREQVPA